MKTLFTFLRSEAPLVVEAIVFAALGGICIARCASATFNPDNDGWAVLGIPVCFVAAFAGIELAVMGFQNNR